MSFQQGRRPIRGLLQESARVLILSLLLAVLANAGTAHAATIIINNMDGPGEGFNDNGGRDYASWQGGNTGSTLGEQRLQAMQKAADVWGVALQSAVPITVDASMDPLECAPRSGTAGFAGPISALTHSASQTIHVVALANATGAKDWYPGTSDIRAKFNSEVGTPTCLSTIQWYYGLDRQSPTGTIDFYATVVHELVHGLGFIDSIDNTTGAFAFAPQPYLFDTFLADRGWINKTVTDMTDGERLSAITSQSNLVWTGAKVTAKAAGVLSAGRHPSTGEVLIYGPLTASETSSVGHFDTSLTPDELMEPFGTPTVDDRLTKALLEDLGWTVTATNTATSTVPVGNLENPGVDSYKSGIGVISGWVCSASSVLVTVDGTPIQTAYGTDRPDTENVCGDTNNGFGVLYNWNRFGDGAHTAIAYADGVEFGRANFTVTTFGVEFLQGVAGWYTFESWPYAGHTLDDKWDQSVQNFVIFNPSLAPVGGSSSSGGNLESPGKGSHKSGIGVISGWHCAASQVTVVIDGISIQTGYGTDRPDTVDVCGDSNNGFGALYNWNRFGDGIHTAIAYADGVEFARANFAVKTFGVEFLTGKSLSLTSPGFPFDGQTTYVQWDEAVQNIVITDVQ